MSKISNKKHEDPCKDLKDFLKEDSGGKIDPKKAEAWRNNYEFVENTMRPGKKLIKGHFFGKKWILKLVDHEDIIGLRIYYGLTENGEKELLLYAVDKEGRDLLPRSGKNNPHENFILDYSRSCPPYC